MWLQSFDWLEKLTEVSNQTRKVNILFSLRDFNEFAIFNRSPSHGVRAKIEISFISIQSIWIYTAISHFANATSSNIVKKIYKFNNKLSLIFPFSFARKMCAMISKWNWLTCRKQPQTCCRQLVDVIIDFLARCFFCLPEPQKGAER